MPGSVERLRDLIFGRGEFAREDAPEPTLLPRLLGVASPALLARAALSGDLFHITQLHPELRGDLNRAIASRLGDLPPTDRATLLEREPALIEHLPDELLPDATAIANATDNEALAAFIRLKMQRRSKRTSGIELAVGRSLLQPGRLATPWRYPAILSLVAETTGKERSELISKLTEMPDMEAQADFVAAIAELLPANERADFLDGWINEEPATARDLGAEWECWALTTVAPQLSGQQYAAALRGALLAGKQLEVSWQRAEAIRQLRRALHGAEASVRSEIGEGLYELVPADEPWRSHLKAYVGKAARGAPSAQVFEAELLKLLPATAAQRESQAVVADGIGALFDRWSAYRSAAAGPTSHAMPPDPPATRDVRAAVASDDFDLGVRSPPAPRRRDSVPASVAAPSPAPPARVVSENLTDRNHPGGFYDPHQPLKLGALYYYWVEIGERAVAGALAPSVLPADLPADAELSVALFAPDGGFVIAQGERMGRLQLHPDGTSHILQQPARTYQGVGNDILKKRLLFPLQAPTKEGRYRLRSNIYYQGVLMESRLIEASVGQAAPIREAEVATKVDYALSRTFAASTLSGIKTHKLSVLMNRNAEGNHDFYFFGSASNKKIHRSVTIGGNMLNNAISEARLGMRRVSWGDDEEFDPDKKQVDLHLKRQTPSNLCTELATLAACGCKIYNALVPRLDDDETAFRETLKDSGLLQISAIEDFGFVLPAAIIYDYPFRSQHPFEKFTLCPVFANAFSNETPLTSTPCFQGACPSRTSNVTVCPSGFWGFRHAIGLPLSLGKRTTDAEFEPKLRYRNVPTMVVAVSTELADRVSHPQDIQSLESEWVAERSWAVGDSYDVVLKLLANNKPHLVYFYCHGGVSERGGSRAPYLQVGTATDEKFVPDMVGQEVHWQDPHPLVFINGCRTTALDADTVLGFVTTLIERSKACGVIGTEITVFEPLASAFATKFWELFLTGNLAIGEAIRLARLAMLQTGNPLGLVYTPFVFAGTTLEKVT